MAIKNLEVARNNADMAARLLRDAEMFEKKGNIAEAEKSKSAAKELLAYAINHI